MKEWTTSGHIVIEQRKERTRWSRCSLTHIFGPGSLSFHHLCFLGYICKKCKITVTDLFKVPTNPLYKPKQNSVKCSTFYYYFSIIDSGHFCKNTHTHTYTQVVQVPCVSMVYFCEKAAWTCVYRALWKLFPPFEDIWPAAWHTRSTFIEWSNVASFQLHLKSANDDVLKKKTLAPLFL